MENHNHLTEQQIAQCAEALKENQYTLLPATLRTHLSECNDCATEVIMIAELLEEVETSELKKKSDRNKLKIPFYISVAASILLFGAIYTYVDFKNSTESKPIVANNTINIINKNEDTTSIQKQILAQKTETPQKQKKKDLKLTTKTKNQLAYTPNTQLEKLSQNFRGTYRGNEVKIISPSLIESSGETSLNWEKSDEQTLTIEIFNNTGELTYSLKTKTNAINLPPLPKGLHYWKMINEEYDLLFVGKIIIK